MAEEPEENITERIERLTRLADRLERFAAEDNGGALSSLLKGSLEEASWAISDLCELLKKAEPQSSSLNADKD